MSPAKNKPAAQKKTKPVKKTEVSNSKTKSVTSKQGLKKKLNEFGDDDAL
ncbi:hypothetical protein [Flavobacterium sp.]|nr:hypothetical protein [Flavobacterium sp.]